MAVSVPGQSPSVDRQPPATDRNSAANTLRLSLRKRPAEAPRYSQTAPPGAIYQRPTQRHQTRQHSTHAGWPEMLIARGGGGGGRCNMRREEWVTVQGPVKEQQPDGMSHRGLRSGRVKPNYEKLREIAEKLRKSNQTPQRLTEQPFCKGGTQGTNEHPSWTGKKQSRMNCGKVRKLRKIADLDSPPDPPATDGDWPCGRGCPALRVRHRTLCGPSALRVLRTTLVEAEKKARARHGGSDQLVLKWIDSAEEDAPDDDAALMDRLDLELPDRFGDAVRVECTLNEELLQDTGGPHGHSFRSVRRMQFSFPERQEPLYTTGDHVAVQPLNDKARALRTVRLLGLEKHVNSRFDAFVMDGTRTVDAGTRCSGERGRVPCAPLRGVAFGRSEATLEHDR